jgi:hypothetical protein
MLRSAYGPVLPETVPQRMAQIDAPDPWLEPPACPKVSKEVVAPKTRMFLRDVQTVSRISKALGLAQQAKGSGCVDYIDYSYRKDLYVTCLKCLFASCSCFCHCSGSLDEPVSSTFTGFSDSSGPGSGVCAIAWPTVLETHHRRARRADDVARVLMSRAASGQRSAVAIALSFVALISYRAVHHPAAPTMHQNSPSPSPPQPFVLFLDNTTALFALCLFSRRPLRSLSPSPSFPPSAAPGGFRQMDHLDLQAPILQPPHAVPVLVRR